MSSPTTLIGNVTSDPVLKYGQSGRAFCTFSVAVGERRKNAEGVWEDAGSSFFNVTVFGSEAENAAESLTKGVRVVVLGSLRLRQYEKSDGSKGLSADVIASEVAPSLKWATARVTRAPRATATQGRHAQVEGGAEV